MSRLAFPIVIRMSWENLMHDNKFLTAEEVSDRYRGSISVGTLRNWRAMRIGPTFVKVGKAVLYPITELDAWDQKNMVTCRASKLLRMDADEDHAGARKTAPTCQFLGIDDLHFHDLRHEGVSRLFEIGRNIPQVAAVSGHRSWSSLKRYTHLRQTGDKYAHWKWLPVVTH
jgi:Phage integrase family